MEHAQDKARPCGTFAIRIICSWIWNFEAEGLLQVQTTLNKTIVFITHDLDEALRIGNRIAILRDGALVQEGTPADILARPADDYVRRFVERRAEQRT
jgi:ABC-type proline/glycine betaine transport system ATPase subunit